MMLPKIAVIDDDPNFLVAFKFSFKTKFDVTTYSSTESFRRDILNGHEFAVVVSDQQIESERSGTDLLLFCRDQCPASSRIMITGHSNHAALLELATKAGISAFIRKPFDRKVFIEQINDGVDQYHENLKALDAKNDDLKLRCEMFESKLKQIFPAAPYPQFADSMKDVFTTFGVHLSSFTKSSEIPGHDLITNTLSNLANDEVTNKLEALKNYNHYFTIDSSLMAMINPSHIDLLASALHFASTLTTMYVNEVSTPDVNFVPDEKGLARYDGEFLLVACCQPFGSTIFNVHTHLDRLGVNRNTSLLHLAHTFLDKMGTPPLSTDISYSLRDETKYCPYTLRVRLNA